MNKASVCPFCGSTCQPCHAVYRQGQLLREFLHCLHCQAIHVPRQFHLPEELEKAEYDKHQNFPQDDGYRRFLARVVDPLRERITAQSEGLDFGCGPGPVLALMLEEAGHKMSLYDLFYYPDEDVLGRSYDFITATEVVEHLADPVSVLDQLWSLLRPGGVLGVMTKRVIDAEAFKTWHYKNDPTHITFFHEQTLRWLADRWQCDIQLVGKDVVFFSKSGGS